MKKRFITMLYNQWSVIYDRTKTKTNPVRCEELFTPEREGFFFKPLLLLLLVFLCTQTALKGCRGIVFSHGVRVGGRREKVCPGCISETVRCRKLILGRDIG